MLKSSMPLRLRDTWAEINLDNIIWNFNEAKKLLLKETKIAAVLKANAYGHGAIEVARILVDKGVDYIAVACLLEAIELRREFKDIPILVMGYTSEEHLHIAVEYNITLTIFSALQGELLSKIASSLKTIQKVHIKIDTGFNRLGFKWSKDLKDIIKSIYKLKNIEVEGIFTHLALVNRQEDEKQFDLFQKVIEEIEEEKIHIPIKHVCDSIGMVRYPEFHMNMIRLGAFLYGMRPSRISDKSPVLKTSLTFKTKISHIKHIENGEGVGYDYSFIAKEKAKVGTLPVGYADGYMRCLSNAGEVSVNGEKAKVIGKICMDQAMIDLTSISNVKVGDEVVLLGGQGENFVDVMEVADKCNTNRNEVLSVISRRVPRVYIKDEKIIGEVNYLMT
ncbi:alanine racemase [Clostridium tunisiense]|uniref:alanine racemase n=1 Tax=Clostridium tunisiense TaxID=219748 RepID=UPI00030FEDC1|nr:alanine racemase [Clostridium tunisiense]